MRRPPETCPGDCSMACKVCALRFWSWAEQHTRGKAKKKRGKGGVETAKSFYESVR